MTGDSNLEHLRRAIEAWNRGDLDAYLELYDGGITLHGYSPQPMDKATVRASTRCSPPPSPARS